MVPPTSAATRSATGNIMDVRGERMAPRCQASAAISTDANRPRTSITWPKFISDDTALVMASLIVKLAMPTTMNRLPRMLGERGK